jgi:hypothetical protein
MLTFLPITATSGSKMDLCLSAGIVDSIPTRKMGVRVCPMQRPSYKPLSSPRCYYLSINLHEIETLHSWLKL